mmetsp:Transcript_9505/g.23341  ORF Transcript_9505/g.23341 Transcript_9505/m.23341 type:complete len:241 (-) Transcript_9505:1985-2707(-)
MRRKSLPHHHLHGLPRAYVRTPGDKILVSLRSAHLGRSRSFHLIRRRLVVQGRQVRFCSGFSRHRLFLARCEQVRRHAAVQGALANFRQVVRLRSPPIVDFDRPQPNRDLAVTTLHVDTQAWRTPAHNAEMRQRKLHRRRNGCALFRAARGCNIRAAGNHPQEEGCCVARHGEFCEHTENQPLPHRASRLVDVGKGAVVEATPPYVHKLADAQVFRCRKPCLLEPLCRQQQALRLQNFIP